MRKLCLATFGLLFTIATGDARAALQAAGPVSPVTSLPAWYQDQNNVALEPCLDQNGFCILTPPFDPAFTNPPDPITTSGPIDDTNFPDESFYFIADSIIDPFGPIGPKGAEKATLRIALEAAFLGGVTPNEGITFLRLNLQRMAGLTPGLYKVTYPYGTFNFTVDANGDTPRVSGQAFRVEDPLAPSPGLWFPPEMQQAKQTHVGPFLTAATGLITDPGTGNVYIGNPGTPSRVTGSPSGTNFFRIEGPNVGAAANAAAGGRNLATVCPAPLSTLNCIQTDLFTLAGRVFTGKIPTFVNLDRVSYARDATGAHVDAFVSATAGAVLDVVGAGLTTTRMTRDPAGAGDRFFATLPFAPGTLPTSVKVWNQSDVPTPTPYAVTLVDEVKVTQADYDPVAKTLTLKAASRDTLASPAPTLTAVNLPAPNVLDSTGTLVAQLGTGMPPTTVQVQSSLGGIGTAAVSVLGTVPLIVNRPPDVRADPASTISNTAVIIDVLSNDSDPDGDSLVVVAVTQPLHGAVTNNGLNLTYLPNNAFTGTDAFSYTVSDGKGGSAVAGVSVTVAPAPNVAPDARPDSAITPFQTAVTVAVLANDSDANGDPLGITAVTQPRVSGVQVGTVTTDGTKVTYTPAGGFAGTAVFTYTVSDGRGGNTLGSVSVVVRPAEQLNVTSATFRSDRNEWRVSGTSSAEGAVIKVHSGANPACTPAPCSNLTGTALPTTATVTAGVWSIVERNSTVPTNGRISVESTGGAVRLNQTVVTR